MSKWKLFTCSLIPPIALHIAPIYTLSHDVNTILCMPVSVYFNTFILVNLCVLTGIQPRWAVCLFDLFGFSHVGLEVHSNYTGGGGGEGVGHSKPH